MHVFIILIVCLFAANPAYAEEKIRILFIGNSYTYTHNMPEMLAKIAASNTKQPVQLYVEAVTRGGAGLPDLWSEGKAIAALQKSSWNFVVLQEQSLWALIPEKVQASYKIAPEWKEKIAAANAHAIVFATWAREPGSAWYSNPETAFLQNPQYMQQELSNQSATLAQLIGAAMLPVGNYWAYALSVQPNLPLYEADGSHPSVAGAYLTALLFYRYVTQHSVDDTTYIPKNIAPDVAAQIRAIASAQANS